MHCTLSCNLDKRNSSKIYVLFFKQFFASSTNALNIIQQVEDAIWCPFLAEMHLKLFGLCLSRLPSCSLSLSCGVYINYKLFFSRHFVVVLQIMFSILSVQQQQVLKIVIFNRFLMFKSRERHINIRLCQHVACNCAKLYFFVVHIGTIKTSSLDWFFLLSSQSHSLLWHFV
jgi:hypothetical protein